MQTPAALRAFRHPNFRLFFIGQSGSMIGIWMQQIAVSWLVYRLTGSALLLGIVGFASNIAYLFVSPVAAIFADRYDRRRMLMAAQSVSAALCALLATLTFLEVVTAWQIIVIMLAIGVATALETPTRHAFILELVERKENLPNAIALNASLFQMARFIGPALAGVFIAAFGEAWCFVVNALSYAWILLILSRIRTAPRPRSTERRDWVAELRAGFGFVFGLMPLRRLVIMLGATSVFVSSYQMLMPLVAAQAFGGNSRTFGFLIGCSGLGALCGSLYLAGRTRVPGLGRFVAAGPLVSGIGLALISQTANAGFGMACMLLIGFGIIITAASTNTLLQSVADEDKRGRVVGIYVMIFLGMQPLGNLAAGALADTMGAQHALLVNGLVAIGVALWFIAGYGAWRRAMRPLYERAGLLDERDR
jgi:MFS family permease